MNRRISISARAADAEGVSRLAMRRFIWLTVFYVLLGAAAVAAIGMPSRLFGPSPQAQAQARAAGKIVLTVRGEGKQAQFDMRALQALPQSVRKVSTPWYLRQVTFQGPRLRDVLDAAGVAGSRIHAQAINDFTVEFPIEVATCHDAIIALSMDGLPMPLRERGPLFLVFPYDDIPAERLGYYYSLSIWQLDQLSVQ